MNFTKYFIFQIYFFLPFINNTTIRHNDMYTTISDKFCWIGLKKLALHPITKLQCLVDIISYDNIQTVPRWVISYIFRSFYFNFFCFYITKAFNLITCLNIFPATVAIEREIWDMYGVKFLNNYDLRRILTDYAFVGHPLRKDFPLSGFIDVIYSDSEKTLLYVPTELTQEFRNFSFTEVIK